MEQGYAKPPDVWISQMLSFVREDLGHHPLPCVLDVKNTMHLYNERGTTCCAI